MRFYISFLSISISIYEPTSMRNRINNYPELAANNSSRVWHNKHGNQALKFTCLSLLPPQECLLIEAEFIIFQKKEEPRTKFEQKRVKAGKGQPKNEINAHGLLKYVCQVGLPFVPTCYSHCRIVVSNNSQAKAPEKSQ